MLSQLEIPQDVREKLIAQLGVSSQHIDEALSLAEKSPNVGVTPFLQRMRETTEFFKSFKNQDEKFEKFSKCASNAERVDMVYQAINSNPKFSNISPLFPARATTGPDQSRQLREAGNKQFKARRLEEAALLYTKAAAAGAGGGGDDREAALALGNRSAVAVEAGRHQDCLHDTEAALLFGYPAELQYRLYARQGRSLLAVGRQHEAQEVLELASLTLAQSKLGEQQRLQFKQEIQRSLQQAGGGEAAPPDQPAPAWPALISAGLAGRPGLSGAVEVVESAGRGRHCLVRQEVRAGDCLLTELPLTWYLSANQASTHCHHCCGRLGAAALPSPLQFPPAAPQFCRLHCLQTALASYHSREAKLSLASLFSLPGKGYDEISGTVLLTIRAVTQRPVEFFTERDWLEGQGKEGEEGEDYAYRALFSLVTHHETRSQADLLATAIKTVFILQLLEALDYCKPDCGLGSVIFRILEAVQYNTHPVDAVAGGGPDPGHSLQLSELGGAVYPSLASCLNHSCDPATVRVCRGNRIAVLARRHLQPGQEVTDCYGLHYSGLGRAERRARLEKWFSFQCECEACTAQFPLLAGLSDKISSAVLQKLQAALQQFQAALQAGHHQQALDSSLAYLTKLSQLALPRPHKAWEAGSHALSCSLWALYGSRLESETITL